MDQIGHLQAETYKSDTDEILPIQFQVADLKAAVAASCPNPWPTPCRRRYVSTVLDLVRRFAPQESLAQVEAVGLPLYCVVRGDGKLDLATVGHHWWTLPAFDVSAIHPAIVDEVPGVDIAGLLDEVRWLQSLHPRVVVKVAADDDTSTREVWAVLWALDVAVVRDRSDRYWTREIAPAAPPPVQAPSAVDDARLDAVADYTEGERENQELVALLDANLLRGVGWTPEGPSVPPTWGHWDYSGQADVDRRLHDCLGKSTSSPCSSGFDRLPE